jgi:hypothetical protein
LKNAKNCGILGLRERSHLNCGLSFLFSEGGMKKSKKTKPRPRWHCEKCDMYWVSCDPVCIICDRYGKPLNEGAEKIINKAKG